MVFDFTIEMEEITGFVCICVKHVDVYRGWKHEAVFLYSSSAGYDELLTAGLPDLTLSKSSVPSDNPAASVVLIFIFDSCSLQNGCRGSLIQSLIAATQAFYFTLRLLIQ